MPSSVDAFWIAAILVTQIAGYMNPADLQLSRVFSIYTKLLSALPSVL
jgi:hypothetical protein